MKRFSLILLVLATSCARTPPTADECRALADPNAVVQRCFGDAQSGIAVSTAECWPYSKPTRLTGLWLLDLERSSFYPNARGIGDIKRQGWGRVLEIENEEDFWKRHPEHLAAVGGAGAPVYKVELEGRQSLCGDVLEHSINPPHVIAQRFYSMRLVARGPANFSP